MTRPPTRTRSLLALLAAALLPACSASVSGPVDGARALAHVRRMVEFGPRPPGSAAIEQTRQWMEAEIRKLGLEPRRMAFRAPGEPQIGEFVNLWTEIPGQDPANGPILALAAHYCSKLTEGHANPAHNFRFVGAIDGAGASCVLLELARHLKERKTVPNVWLIWFDGEESLEFEWNDKRALFGSRHFAAAMQADKQRFPKGLAQRMKAFVLLDLIGDKDLKIDRDLWSNGDLQKVFLEAAKRMGEERRMFAWESKITDDHIPFQKLGVPVINLIDFFWRDPNSRKDPAQVPASVRDLQAWWHTPEDTVDKMSAASLALAGNLVWTALPGIEARFFPAAAR